MPHKVGDFDLELVAEFFQAFVNNSACNLHIRVLSGKNAHHIIEAVFKSFARALDSATRITRAGAESARPKAHSRVLLKKYEIYTGCSKYRLS